MFGPSQKMQMLNQNGRGLAWAPAIFFTGLLIDSSV